eukprot:s216_g2.t1
MQSELPTQAGTKNIELCDLEGAVDCESHILKPGCEKFREQKNRDSAASDPTTVTAVCPLPMEPGTQSRLLDWIWLGLSNGEMFGILVEDHAQEKFSVHKSSGRFKRNTHCQGVPIYAIMSVSQPSAASAQSVYYSLTMRRRDMCPNTVLSIGAESGPELPAGFVALVFHCMAVVVHLDGKLLRTERCPQTHQWVPSGEWSLPVPGKGFAAASSALLPSLLLLADEASQCMMVAAAEPLQVLCLDLRPSDVADVDLLADLRNPATIQKMLFDKYAVQEMVIAVKPPLLGPSYQTFMEINLAGLADLVNMAERHNVRSLLYVSSFAACNHWVPHHNVAESDPAASPPLTSLRFILQKHSESGMRTVSIRIGGVYGDNDDQYWNRRLPFRLSLDISDQDAHPPKIDANYVENVAEGMLRVVDRLSADTSVGGRREPSFAIH